MSFRLGTMQNGHTCEKRGRHKSGFFTGPKYSILHVPKAIGCFSVISRQIQEDAEAALNIRVDSSTY